MNSAFRIEVEREDHGRWIAEVMDLPGVLAYGTTRDEALTRDAGSVSADDSRVGVRAAPDTLPA